MTPDMIATLVVYAVLAVLFTWVVTKDIPHEPPGPGPDDEDEL